MQQYYCSGRLDDVVLIGDGYAFDIYNMTKNKKLVLQYSIQRNTDNCQLTIINNFDELFNSFASTDLLPFKTQQKDYPSPLIAAIEYCYMQSKTLAYFHLLEKYNFLDEFETCIKDYFDVISLARNITTAASTQRHYLLKKKSNITYKTTLFKIGNNGLDRILLHDNKCYLYNWSSMVNNRSNFYRAIQTTQLSYFFNLKGGNSTAMTQLCNYQNLTSSVPAEKQITDESTSFLNLRADFKLIIETITNNVKPFGYVEPIVEKPIPPIPVPKVKKAVTKKLKSSTGTTTTTTKPKVSKSKKIT